MAHDIASAERTVPSGGRRRRYLATAPAEAAGASLVLVLHGSIQTPRSIRAQPGPGFDELASRYGAVVAYPRGHRRRWNSSRPGPGRGSRVYDRDDVAFLCAVIDDAVRRYGVDRGRVYAVGFSNGGQMVSRLAHEAPERLAGIALIGATQHAPEFFTPVETAPRALPALLIHGTRDPIVPYGGGRSSVFDFLDRTLDLSAAETAAYWVARDGADPEPRRRALPRAPGDRTRVERADHDGPAPVRTFTVHGGGHTLPGARRSPRVLGRTSRGISTVDEIADFFGLDPG